MTNISHVTYLIEKKLGVLCSANGYAWHDGHTGHYGLSEAEETSIQDHANNAQAYAGKAPCYADFVKVFGKVNSDMPTSVKFYPYKPEHVDAALKLVNGHGYTPYLIGGKYPMADLSNKNYDTGDLAIWDPSDGSGGDFCNEAYTKAWRYVHELAHALTRKEVNKTYGEGRRIGKLGYQRTTNEALRAVHWEWLVAHKQRELNSRIGVIASDADFAMELNNNMIDAVHRAVTGKFTNPETEGFTPSNIIIPLKTSLDIVHANAKRLHLAGVHDTLKRKSTLRPSYS